MKSKESYIIKSSAGAMEVCKMELKQIYNKWYFESKYRYSKKKTAIQHHYYGMLVWANRHSLWNLLNGYGKKALDIGCAYGFITDLLSRLGYEALGIDVSNYAVMRGREFGIKNLLESDVSHPPFKAMSFDLITCFEVLEHLPDPTSALTGIYRLLDSQGIFLAITPNVGSVASAIGKLSQETPSTHPSVKPPNKWIETLSKLQFSSIKFEPFLLLPMPPTLLNRYFMVKCTSRLASHIRILAIKPSEEENR